ncbi:MAG: diguanylate cyclase domain-containing protein [Gaiellaceae bacterium]
MEIPRATILPRLYPFWLFIAGVVAAFATLPIGARETHGDNIEIAVAAVLVAGIFGATLVPWGRVPHAFAAVPVVASFAVVGLLRDAEGGAQSGYGPLVLLPVVWLALHASRRVLVASFIAVGAVFVVPILVQPSLYPGAEWRRALLWMIVTPVVGLTTQNLVERVRASSLADPLTGLANRRAWNERLERTIAYGMRAGHPFSIALVDLDGFKAYNDSHGHLAGDRLLVRVAREWQRRVRGIDLLVRLGGDEFALLLPDATCDQARAAVARALEGTPDVSSSVGVAEWNGDESADALAGRADAELYADKARRGDAAR